MMATPSGNAEEIVQSYEELAYIVEHWLISHEEKNVRVTVDQVSHRKLSCKTSIKAHFNELNDEVQLLFGQAQEAAQQERAARHSLNAYLITRELPSSSPQKTEAKHKPLDQDLTEVCIINLPY